VCIEAHRSCPCRYKKIFINQVVALKGNKTFCCVFRKDYKVIVKQVLVNRHKIFRTKVQYMEKVADSSCPIPVDIPAWHVIYCVVAVLYLK
jgi:hypothetical protein